MKNPFNRFLLKILLFGVAVLAGFEIFFRLGFTPIITDSMLFDHKMLEVHQRPVGKLKLMTMGSSTSMYALNSALIEKNFDVSYYNFATWRLHISDISVILRELVKEYKPEYVIMCVAIGEFRDGADSTYLNYTQTSPFIRNHFPEIFYFKHYSSLYQIAFRKFTEHMVSFDQWGGVPLTVKPKDIDQAAWNYRVTFPTSSTPAQYRVLDSLAEFLRQQKVRLIYVQAPIKAAHANTPEANQALRVHFDTCRSIIEGHGGIYLNYYNTTIFTDSLFLDQYHLQNSGGIVMTKELIADLKKMRIIN